MFLSMLRSINLWILVVEPRLAERREILPGVAVEHQLVVDDVKRDVGAQAVARDLVLRNARVHGARRVHIAVFGVGAPLVVMEGHE